MEVLEHIDKSGIRKDAILYNVILKGYLIFNDLEEGLNTHKKMIEQHVNGDVVTYVLLFQLYSKLNDFQEIYKIFTDNLQNKDLKRNIDYYNG